MRVPLALVLTAALASSCSGGSTQAQPTASPAPVTAFSALTPPDSPGVGTFDAFTTNRAYLQAQGLLAEAVLDHDSLTGVSEQTLATDLAGQGDPTVLHDLAFPSTSNGLAYHPLFASSVTVPDKDFVQVARSTWGGTMVQGLQGEPALRISWTGALRYSVVYDGKPVTVAYALVMNWIYTANTVEPGGINHITSFHGVAHLAPQPAACTKLGIIVPVGPAPTDVDVGVGPYPAEGPGACPVTARRTK